MWSNVISPSSSDNSPSAAEHDNSQPPSIPPTRYKHSCTLHYSRSDNCYYIYVYGGNSNRFALKDFWELNVETGEWREIVKPSDSPTGSDTWPPRLQEHTLVSANNRLYMFGGELCANSDVSSHVWVWQREHENRGWEKIRFKQENCGSGGSGGGGVGRRHSHACGAPSMRRGHSCVVCEVDGVVCIVVYGGYRDLKGSLGDCWGYAVATNTWTLLSTPMSSSGYSSSGKSSSSSHQPSFWTNILNYWSSSSSSSSSSTSYTNLSQCNYRCKHSGISAGSGGEDNAITTGPQPSPRHSHSAVHYKGKMYVYGGMCDLVELSDFWTLDLETRRWSQVKCMFSPGVLKGHAAVVVGPFMYVFGGETKGGVRVDDVWRFEFAGETFEKLSFPSCHPCPRVFATATKLPTRRKPQHHHNNHNHQNNMSSYNKEEETRRPQSPPQTNNTKPTRPSTFRKSTSVVRFADTQHLVTYSDDYYGCSSSASASTANTPSCSDYSSMETINPYYVENPNYRKYGESFEMKPIGWRDNNKVPCMPVRENVVHYVLMIGGLETHRSAVFSKRDLVVWRLRVDICGGGGGGRDCTDDYEEEDYFGGGGGEHDGEFISGGNGVGNGGGGISGDRGRNICFGGSEVERGDKEFDVEF